MVLEIKLLKIFNAEISLTIRHIFPHTVNRKIFSIYQLYSTSASKHHVNFENPSTGSIEISTDQNFSNINIIKIIKQSILKMRYKFAETLL